MRDLAKQLDDDFAEWSRGLTFTERAELKLYQATGYLKLNSLLRGEVAASQYSAEALEKIDVQLETIDGAIEKGSLMGDIRLYRGLRDWEQVFGVPDLESLVGHEFNEHGYFSSSIDPKVATGMTVMGVRPTLFVVDAPGGSEAAWLSLAGDRRRREEFEVLLPRRRRVKIEGVGAYGDVPTIEGRLIA